MSFNATAPQPNIDALIQALTPDPVKNLRALAAEAAKLTGASDCLVTCDGEVIASLSGSADIPAGGAGCYIIPVIAKEWREELKHERRAENRLAAEPKKSVCLVGAGNYPAVRDSEIFSCLLALVCNNIEAFNSYREASIDRLTGALNRKYLDIAIDRAFDRAKNSGSPVSVIIGDLDFFKHVNDTYGHIAGDGVLRETSRIMMETVGGGGVLGRYGGEEFVVLMENTGSAAAYAMAERIRGAILGADILSGKRDITLSLGVASYPEHAPTRGSIIDRADKALYMAKKDGRNRTVAWNDSFNSAVVVKNVAREVATGDSAKDGERMAALFDILEISGQSLPLAVKLALAFDRLMDASCTENAALFTLEGGEISKTYGASRRGAEAMYNYGAVNRVIKDRAPVFTVDWDNETTDASGVADWLSLAVVPVIKDGALKGVLYLSVSVKVKEFSADEAGLICCAGMLLAAYL